MQWLQAQRLPGIIDLTPGIRSLQVHYDSRALPLRELLDALIEAEDASCRRCDDIEVPTRIVHLPLSWDDPATRLAIEKYMQSVRPDAPWCPSNIEFIRRINGLDSIEDVQRIVFDASYLVLGLGDVYLGAPVATPVDPRHRLVTTKYNPARTWTPENAVGIGGAYLCIYGMEGPGGYQFVGRTVQMWNRYRQTADFTDGKPWLLRFFDQIRFFPVSAQRAARAARGLSRSAAIALRGRGDGVPPARLQALPARRMPGRSPPSRRRQQAAFEAERERWRSAGQAEFASDATLAGAAPDSELDLPPNARAVATPVAGNVWKVPVRVGDSGRQGRLRWSSWSR